MRRPTEQRRHPVSTDKRLVGFRVGDVEYAVDIARVREIIRPLPIVPMPHAPAAVAGVADHRGEVVPVLDVRRRFGLEPAPTTRRTKWILVEASGRVIGLVADEVTEVLAASAEDRRALPDLGPGDAARGIASVVAHRGKLVFVLDVDRVVAAPPMLELAAGASEEAS